MLLVITTKSLIKLDNTVRASFDDDCMTNRHDEYQWNTTEVDDCDDANTTKARNNDDELDRDRTRVEN